MSANERLQEKQAALLDRGVKDVKFCFALGLDSVPKSEVDNSVADFLDAYMDNRYKELGKIEDIPAAAAAQKP